MNKEDGENHNIRARLVAQAFTKGEVEAIFAAKPPWEAKKRLFSMAVTEGIGYGPGWHYKTDFMDINRAY